MRDAASLQRRRSSDRAFDVSRSMLALDAERVFLLGPDGREVREVADADAARQPAVDDGPHDAGREMRERERHADGAVGQDLARGDRGGAADASMSRARPSRPGRSRWPSGCGRDPRPSSAGVWVLAWRQDDVATAPARRRRPGMHDHPALLARETQLQPIRMHDHGGEAVGDERGIVFGLRRCRDALPAAPGRPPPRSRARRCGGCRIGLLALQHRLADVVAVAHAHLCGRGSASARSRPGRGCGPSGDAWTRSAGPSARCCAMASFAWTASQMAGSMMAACWPSCTRPLWESRPA